MPSLDVEHGFIGGDASAWLYFLGILLDVNDYYYN